MAGTAEQNQSNELVLMADGQTLMTQAELAATRLALSLGSGRKE
jgi:hypothetical protein